MAIIRTEAFVLKAFRFGETSMIYRLLTRDAAGYRTSFPRLELIAPD